MPITTTYQVEGLKELEEQFGRLERSTRRGIQRKAMREALKPIRNTARRNAPKESGKGKRNIRARVTVRGTEAVGKVGTSRGTAYMNRQEMGTRFMPAQPWLRPAADAEAQNAVRIYGRVMDEQIREAISREINGDGEEEVSG